MPPDASALAGVIPQVEILELIGAGGMGAVYKGRQASLDRTVAVKVLRPDLFARSTFADRFAREAKALSRLVHPNIVAVHDAGQANGVCYIVMEYVAGTTLRQLMTSRALPPNDVLSIVRQVCDALQFAHEQGVFHRDVKPENVLVDAKGRVILADFGLAKLGGLEPEACGLTATNQVMGTFRYMAPEQMEGSKGADHRADWSSQRMVDSRKAV